jgi:hypothetical protein
MSTQQPSGPSTSNPAATHFQPYSIPSSLSRRVSSLGAEASFENLDPQALDQVVEPGDSVSNISSVPGSHLSHHSSQNSSRASSRPVSHIGTIGTARHGPLGEPPRLEWSDDLKWQFEHSLVMLIAACNLPFNFVEHPEWNKFCAEWIPGSPQVGRKPLNGRVLFNLVESFCTKTREEAKGKMVTLQSNGWTSKFRTHLIAFLISIHSTKQVHKAYKVYLISI